MSENEEYDISKKISCMEKKVDRVLRSIEGDREMGADGLAKQVKENRQLIEEQAKTHRESIKVINEKIQWQDKKIAGWAGFMGAFGAFLGFIAAIATGIIRGMIE